MNKWYLPTLLVFCLAASVAGVDYAISHWQTATLTILGVIGCGVVLIILAGGYQAWKDARETDKLLGGGL